MVSASTNSTPEARAAETATKTMFAVMPALF
jgi:hypothetical protein